MEQCATVTGRRADGPLIEACRQGSREAFRLLFDAYKDRVYSIALYFMHGDETAAEDVTQEVFLRLFTKIGQYRSEAEFATWLYRLVANACTDEQRKRKRLVFFADAPEPPADAALELPEEVFRRREVAASVQAALADLSPELRMTVFLKYFEELSYEEMASALGCSKGTIASRLHRGLKLLAAKLDHLRPTITTGE